MVSTIDRWSQGDEIYRSTDGGKKWKPLLPKVVRDDAGAKYLYWHKPTSRSDADGWATSPSTRSTRRARCT